jgi:hypothetical protein
MVVISEAGEDHGGDLVYADLDQGRLDRVDHLVVGDRGDIDADVVAGDDALGLDRQRDDPE